MASERESDAEHFKHIPVKVPIWMEETWYADCPQCGEAICLGENLKFKEGDTGRCHVCDLDFEIEVPFP